MAIRLQALGDVVITLPYLQCLRNTLPVETRLDLLTRQEVADIPASIDLFDQVYCIGGGRDLKQQVLRTGLLLPKLSMQRYDVVIDLQNSRLSRIVRRMLRPSAWSAFDRFSARSAGERNRLTIEAAGLGANQLDDRLRLRRPLAPDILSRKGLTDADRLVVLNPAGAFVTRNWELHKYVRFARLWLERWPDTKFLLLGTSFIAEKAAILQSELGEHLVNLVGETTPAEAFSVLQRVSLVLSEDSGLMHMAWVSGTPVVALLGSTRSDWARPLGPGSLVLDSSDLPCGNCMQERCQRGDVFCLSRRTPEEVFARAVSLLVERQPERPGIMAPANSTRPQVSVVLPAFNRLRFLEQAVDSVYGQTFTDWELIVADDGSEPETRQYLESLAHRPRVTVVWLSHTGRPAIVRNAALRRANGEYVAFLDSDDLWAPTKLERQMERLRARPHCRWSYTAFLGVDAGGNALPDEARRRWVPYEGDIFDQVATTRASIRTPSVLAARQLIAQAGGFDETMVSAEDYDLWLRLALLSEVALVDEPLVHVRYHDENHHREWQSAYVGRDRSLRLRQQLVRSGRRSLLREERMRNALLLAAAHAERGAQGPVLRALWESLPFSWHYPQWWLGVSKAVLRPHVSPRLLEAYRRRRSTP